MIITKTINLDLWIHERPQEIHAVQGDSCTRKITINLFVNREPWVPEGDVSIAIRYEKPDGTKGTYDTLPTGEKAWALADNKVSFIMAPQMLTVPGYVIVQVELLSGSNVLGSFPLHILVEKNVAAEAVKSADYFNWSQRLERKLEEKLKEAKESGVFDGSVGITPDLQIGSVVTLESGSEAEATIEGSAEKPILNLALPRGADAQIDATLTVSGCAADAKATGEALAGKAPAGYGLGEKVNTCDQLGINSLDKPGWAGFYSNGGWFDDSYNFNAAIIRTDGSGQWRTQTAYPRYSACEQKRVWDGTESWYDWEWVNPPMETEVEYRTTERYMGKPVYTKVVSFGVLPSSAQKTVSCGVTNPQNLVDCRVVAYSVNDYQCVLPIAGSSGLQASYYLSDWSLVIQTYQDMSEYTSCYATIKYTKTTD